MKKRKKIINCQLSIVNCLLMLFILSAASMNAQVRIGSLDDPRPGTVLDLKQPKGSTGYVGGLLLPSVDVIKLTEIPPAFSDNGTIDPLELEGLVVYNTDPTTGPGIFIWTGAYWENVSNPATVSAVNLSWPKLTLLISGANRTTFQLKATVLPETVANKTVTWSSSNPSVATVDQNGLISAVATGFTSITAKAGSQTATCVVEVKEDIYPITNIVLPATKNVQTNKDVRLFPVFTPDNATYKVLKWTSDNPDVAGVDENGKVTGISIGTAHITATDQWGNVQSNICTVTVSETMPSSITIQPYFTTGGLRADIPLNDVANSRKGRIQLSAVLGDSILLSTAAKQVIWTSSDPTKATIDTNTGLVEAVAVGTTTITATTVNNLTSQITVRVLNVTVPVTAITAPNPVTVPVYNTLTGSGGSVQEDIIHTPSNVTLRSVIWEISDPTAVRISHGTGAGSTMITGLRETSSPVEVVYIAADGSGVRSNPVYVTVKSDPLEKIDIAAKKLVLQQGQSAVVSPGYIPSGASVSNVIWYSANQEIADLTQVGTNLNTMQVDAINVGTTTITITADAVSTSLEVEVVPADAIAGCGTVQSIGGKDYPTRQYGNVCWMVENLKGGTQEGIDYMHKSYNGQNEGASKGYYYTWEQAINACPAGWSLPTEAEWNNLRAIIARNENQDENMYNDWANAANRAGYRWYNTVSGQGWAYNGTRAAFWGSDTPYVIAYVYDGSITGASLGATWRKGTYGTIRCIKSDRDQNRLLTGLSLNQNAITLTTGGTTNLLEITNFIPANASNRTVSWSSNATGIATVNASTGVVTGVAPGNTIITGSNGGITVTCLIEVVDLQQSPDCGNGGAPGYIQIKNNRYKTHEYDGVCWIVDNLKEGAHTGLAYGDNMIQSPASVVSMPASLGTMGYYYNQFQARYACPAGWELPTKAQFTSLVAILGNTGTPETTKVWWKTPNRKGGIYSGHINGWMEDTRLSIICSTITSRYIDYIRTDDFLIYSVEDGIGTVRCVKQ
jgi:uncharacterized protein (TIGR02145 family)